MTGGKPAHALVFGQERGELDVYSRILDAIPGFSDLGMPLRSEALLAVRRG